MTLWKHRSELTAINLCNLVLAAFLFASPWLLGYPGQTAATWTACVLGALIALVALAAVIDMREWEAWASLALGLGATVAPWIAGFSGVAFALWSHVGVGLAVAILAGVELWLMQSDDGTLRTT